MAKPKTGYSCKNCGHFSSKWLGRCPACEEWNSLHEEIQYSESESSSSIVNIREEFRREEFRTDSDNASKREDWVPLHVDGEAIAPKPMARLSTGISELDRVLGGGLVPDSFTLLGGDPGIGKSTLLLQMAIGVCQKNPEIKVLYASGEESVDQIRGRSNRLVMTQSGKRSNLEGIFLSAETQLERVFGTVKEIKPQILVVDSLQTFSTGFVQSAPGSVGQVREVAARLMALAKSAGIAVWLVGHVTKEGSIAGPKTVEHMVDTVLYFEGEGGQSYRLLRTVKNRFGSTRELGVFEMEGEGLREVTNPSSLFLSERKEAVSGTAIAAPMEGSRPLLVEVQALVTPSGLAMPRRTSVGLDGTRVSLLAAILEKHMKLTLAAQDLFFNVSGGLKLSEPACDLAAAAAIWSSAKERALPLGWVFIGELGLTGEVRAVSQTEMRLLEARRLGFGTVVLPATTPKVIYEKLAANAELKVVLIARVQELSSIL